MDDTISTKVLYDEDGNKFFPITATSALVDPIGRSLDTILNSKLELPNLVQGPGIVLTKDSVNNIVVIASNSAGLNLIDNLTTTSAEQGALDAHQGYVLKGLIDAVPVVDVIDNLTTVDGTKALSAYQGYLLNNKFNDYALISSLKTVATSGSYNDLSDKPTIPSKTSDLNNDSGFIDNSVNDLINYYDTDATDILLANKEDVANKVTTIDNTSTDTQYPSAKSVYDFIADNKVVITSTNTPPDDSGTWELIDKEFAPYYSSASSAITWNSTNTTPASCTMRVARAGHSLNITLGIVNKVQLTDTTVAIGTLKLADLGIDGLPIIQNITGWTDGANCAVFFYISQAGAIESRDIIPDSVVSAGASIGLTLTITMVTSKMLDSACNKFYWEKIV